MLHPDESQLRHALKDAIAKRGSETVLREVKGVAINTVRNFIKGDKETRRATLDAIRQWHLDNPPPEGMKSRSGGSFEAGRIVGQAEAIATMLRSALVGQEQLIESLRLLPMDPDIAATIASAPDLTPAAATPGRKKAAGTGGTAE